MRRVEARRQSARVFTEAGRRSPHPSPSIGRGLKYITQGMAAEVIARLVVELDQRIWVTGKGRALAHGARNRSTDVNGAKPRPGTERGLRSATLARGSHVVAAIVAGSC